MPYAGDEPVPPALDPLLVERQPRNEPGGLQDEDGRDGDRAADAERLEAGQDLEIRIR